MLLSVDMSGVDILALEIGVYSCSPGVWSGCDWRRVFCGSVSVPTGMLQVLLKNVHPL
jgi:hypothetical protein